jgi:glycosyl transferase family 25
MDLIEKIVYINLDYRTDRRQNIENTLKGYKYERFPAIKYTPGCVGCTLSHIAVLEKAIANKWKNVLIMEDDMEWKNTDTSALYELLSNPYDAIVLGGIGAKYDTKTHKLRDCAGTGAYIVNQHYYQTLLANFKEGLSYLKLAVTQPKIIWGLQKRYHKDHYTIDMYWRLLQRKDNWFLLPFFHGIDDYSDVNNRINLYRQLFA